MTALDAVKDFHSGLGSRPVGLAIHAFVFEHPKEAPGRSDVGVASRGTHAADQVVLLRSKSTALIRVQNDRKSILMPDSKMSALAFTRCNPAFVGCDARTVAGHSRL